MTLKELIDEAKKGSIAAEQALFNRLSGNFFLLCLRFVKNTQDAEELLLDGFQKFFGTLKDYSYKSDAGVMSWLNNIMVNGCISFLRNKRIFNIVAEPFETDAILDEDRLDKLSVEEIHAMIRQLPTGARTIFNLYAVEGYKHEEIAEALGITVSTSKSQLARARFLLQKTIKVITGEDEKYSKH